MAVKRGICSHCGEAIKLDDAFKASRCPYCGNIVETWAALKLAAADAPSGASAGQPSPASHAPQGQGTAPVGPDMRKGECPHCGKNLMVDARSETMMCPACRNKFKTAAAIRLASSGAQSAPPRPAANGTSAPAGSSAALASTGSYMGDSDANLKKKRIIGIAVAVAVVVIVVIVLAATLTGGIYGTYVGTNTDWDVVIELKRNKTFTIKETSIRSGRQTIVEGTFELLGSNESIVKFIPDQGRAFTCEIMVNIHGTPFISFAGVISGYPACYKS